MNIAPAHLSSTNLDHHGLVAAACQDLGIASKINALLGPKHDQRVVSAGTSVVAMILNGLGFTNHRLYLTPQFFENKPVARLLGEPIEATSLTDHTLGQTLDEIAAHGSSQLFAEVAFDIALEHNLLSGRNHLDTSTLSVQGQYANSAAGDSAPHLTYGHSKDHRPDLKQLVLSLTVNGPADMPLWMEVLDGNSSDKVNFHDTIKNVQAFQAQVSVTESFKWVADSALYSKTRLLARNDYLWLSRVPETLKEAKALVSLPADQLTWSDQGAGYQTARYESHYGDVQQRWLLVYSEQAHQREIKTFEKELAKKEKQLDKVLHKLSKQVFSCEQDAQTAFIALRDKQSAFFTLKPMVEKREKYPGKGRPAAGAERVLVGYRLSAEARRNEAVIQQARNRKGRFILATNDLDEQRCPDEQMLREYKQQQGVERGFRFLKDPWFMVDSIFLKSPERIEALMMVMTLCLLVYNVTQYRLREALKTQKETLPNQLNKPVQNPTLRWIFQLMEGISIVTLSDTAGSTQEFVTNLTEVRQKTIMFFGKTACWMYGIVIPQKSVVTLGM